MNKKGKETDEYRNKVGEFLTNLRDIKVEQTETRREIPEKLFQLAQVSLALGIPSIDIYKIFVKLDDLQKQNFFNSKVKRLNDTSKDLPSIDKKHFLVLPNTSIEQTIKTLQLKKEEYIERILSYKYQKIPTFDEIEALERENQILQTRIENLSARLSPFASLPLVIFFSIILGLFFGKD